ncbi:MAG: phosphoglycerate dehydrogenase [Microscillaceae bacterium]|nr:phosphoglycerate dehydrogenase [Microscillaceae bacterium]MDW8461275.1 phosphoglycerate dehydrogenase [Cytophagales bacterium]
MEGSKKYIIIDFDSTFTKVEGLDVLAEIALENHPQKEQYLAEIKKLTQMGMEGKISFAESLNKRIQLLHAHKKHFPTLVAILKTKISDSFQRNKTFFELYKENILVVSSGFREFIEPIVTEFGILPQNIFANECVFDDQGNLIGYRPENVLSEDKGKVKLLKSLNLQGDVYVLGDGYTDYEIREAGLANKFYAFTENVERQTVTQKADHIAPSLEEFLYDNKLPMAISYPKNRINVLLLENIHPVAIEYFKQEGYTVEILREALDEDELAKKIKNVSILGIRSKTQVTRKVLENANKLMLIGAYCIGTNQIDLEACLEKGIVVFNAPYSNTRSVVELAIGEMIMLMRKIFDKSQKMHQGVWDKSAEGSFEIRGKKLGIIGYGNIGTQLSVLAESLGLEVYYYDIVEKLALGNAKKCKSLHELLALADIVSLHVDGRPENDNMISYAEFEIMKKGVIFLNLSRGSVVNTEALVQAIRTGKVAGAGVDVFLNEPKTNKDPFVSSLQGLPNVILTPHIGGSTEEAQANIGEFVANKTIQYINKGDTFGSVNFPNLQLPLQKNSHRLIHIHENVAGILAKINQVLAKNGINILGQYLKTNEKIGYVITDIDKEYNKQVIAELRNIPNTVKFRVLF